ncbi:conserved hypothetical protein [Ricinus communis]|uniref:DUF4408 domain-containing protein n=1 Tax=Ricinus communis TaxID=3988 RepID=B9RK72_RICCO|nr:conserved hypothetical protein [Ricinus communis]|eukprot:XP_002514116.1 uncharacterized protein LOC8272553 [Ricinus communis]
MAEPLLSSSVWSFTTGWSTPTSLFLFLNLVIGTIAVISRFSSNKTPPDEEIRPLTRAPSLIDRVKSINLSSYKYSPQSPEFETAETTIYGVSDDPPRLERAPSLLERVKSIKFPSIYRSEPETEEHRDARQVSGLETELEHHVIRSKSEVAPAERKVEANEKMKKSASERAIDELREDDRESVEKRRPAETRLEKTASFRGGDDGVDAKADDFINRFKQQLKLQRLDSLLRYRDRLKGK